MYSQGPVSVIQPSYLPSNILITFFWVESWEQKKGLHSVEVTLEERVAGFVLPEHRDRAKTGARGGGK